MIRGLLVLALMMLSAVGAMADDLEVTGRIANGALTETSGIAVSQRDRSLLWAVNDSGHAPALYALGLDGTDRGVVRVRGASNRDWEDLASFRVGDRAYLLIADSGDNAGVRPVSYLHLLEEPYPDAEGRFDAVVPVARRIPFRFEDGPQDCEAVAVDAAAGRIVLVAKRKVPPGVYELPLSLDPTDNRLLTAQRIGVVSRLPRPTPRELLEAPLGPWRHQPTALDISPDGAAAVLATYQNLYVFWRRDGESWGATLAAQPRVLPLPLDQFEAAAFVDGRVLTVAEGRAAALMLSPALGR